MTVALKKERRQGRVGEGARKGSGLNGSPGVGSGVDQHKECYSLCFCYFVILLYGERSKIYGNGLPSGLVLGLF